MPRGQKFPIEVMLRAMREVDNGVPVSVVCRKIGMVELTPTMKLKRKPIAVKYAARIDALYAGPDAGCDAE